MAGAQAADAAMTFFVFFALSCLAYSVAQETAFPAISWGVTYKNKNEKRYKVIQHSANEINENKTIRCKTAHLNDK